MLHASAARVSIFHTIFAPTHLVAPPHPNSTSGLFRPERSWCAGRSRSPNRLPLASSAASIHDGRSWGPGALLSRARLSMRRVSLTGNVTFVPPPGAAGGRTGSPVPASILKRRDDLDPQKESTFNKVTRVVTQMSLSGGSRASIPNRTQSRHFSLSSTHSSHRDMSQSRRDLSRSLLRKTSNVHLQTGCSPRLVGRVG